MTGVTPFFSIALLVPALLYAAYGDWLRRDIPNKLNAAIALAAPLYWWAAGFSLWPEIAIIVGLALALFLLFTLAFAIGAMGGGDDFKRVIALAGKGDYEEALSIVLAMLRADPDEEKALIFRYTLEARLFHRSEQFHDAAQRYYAVLGLDPDNREAKAMIEKYSKGKGGARQPAQDPPPRPANSACRLA